MINAVHLVRESVRHVRLMREQEKVLSWHWSSIMMRYKLTYTADLIRDTLQAWPVRWHQRKDVYVSGWSKHGLTKATYCTANAFPPNASFLTDWIGPKTATAYIIQNTNSRCWVHSLICRFMSFPKPIPSSVLFPDLLQLYFPPDAFVLVHSQPQVSSTNASMPPVIVDGCWELNLWVSRETVTRVSSSPWRRIEHTKLPPFTQTPATCPAAGPMWLWLTMASIWSYMSMVLRLLLAGNSQVTSSAPLLKSVR